MPMRTVVAALSGLLGCGLAGPAVNESDGGTTSTGNAATNSPWVHTYPE